MAAVVPAAWLWPEVGVEGGVVGADWIRSAAVTLIFFFQGLSLSFQSLCRGVMDVRLHLCCQIAIFVIGPLLALLLLAATSPILTDPALRAGFIYLGILPTTVASATALTSVAGGNVTGALFNATLSNIAGVFIVPLVVFIFLIDGNEESVSLGQGLAGVIQLILVPLSLGMVCRSWLGRWAATHRVALRRATAAIILYLIYIAFCRSFTEAVWERMPGSELAVAAAGAVLFLVLLSVASWRLARAFRLPPSSLVAALFCGSQKTLVAGLPMAVSLFAATDARELDLSLVLVPLLCYHPMQLLLAGWLVPVLAKRTGGP